LNFLHGVPEAVAVVLVTVDRAVLAVLYMQVLQA
jgi:hypothetical protein